MKLSWRGIFPAITTQFKPDFSLDMDGIERVKRLVKSVTLGAVGWVSGMFNVFPREVRQLFELVKAGRMDDALTLYRWFMSLLHLDERAEIEALMATALGSKPLIQDS